MMSLSELWDNYVGENATTIKEWKFLECKTPKQQSKTGRTLLWVSPKEPNIQYRFLNTTRFNVKLRKFPKNKNRVNFCQDQHGIIRHIWIG